ncbi:MAG: cation:proton antiporter [Gammaproteobacteria bacterium SG8_31]|jgi:multicomponent Na+:H+ antiporter subunit D|nr:MAG: cation:proton antiporter [Gammaproteobacteria bacterium SG8_31]
MELAVALPAAASIPIALTGRFPNLRETVTLITALVVFVLVASAVPGVLAGDRPELTLTEFLPGLALQFRLEPLGMIFALVASFLWLITSIYSIGYMRGHDEQHQTRFYVCFALAIASALGVAFAGNMLTLFAAYEVLSISTYPLVTHSGTEEARRAGRLYLGILLGTSIGFQLLAILWTWTVTGTLDFTEGGILAGEIQGPAAAVLLALYVFGIGKAAVMPFHRWLPAAMVAPTPVSALLHAVAVVKAGVFAILKVVIYIFGTDFILQNSASDWLVWFAGATILLASLVAMTKDNLKARLAYSTISQLSYIVLGALLATQASIIGSMMHIAMHAFAKITLFFAAGAVLVAAHKSEISDMAGLGRAMPITFGAFFVASLSIIGLPPLGGMWSKWYLGLGTIESGQWLLLTVLLVSSLLNIAYLLPIPMRAFFGKPKDGTVHTRMREAPASCLVAMIITSLACLVMFFYPEPFYRLATTIAGAQ